LTFYFFNNLAKYGPPSSISPDLPSLPINPYPRMGLQSEAGPRLEQGDDRSHGGKEGQSESVNSMGIPES